MLKIRKIFVIVISLIVIVLVALYAIVPFFFQYNFIKEYCILDQGDGCIKHVDIGDKKYTFAISKYNWYDGFCDLHLASDVYYDGNTGEKLSVYENVTVRLTPFSGGKAVSVEINMEYLNSVGELVMDTVWFDNDLNLLDKDKLSSTEQYMLEHNMDRIEKLLVNFYEQWSVFEFNSMDFDELNKN